MRSRMCLGFALAAGIALGAASSLMAPSANASADITVAAYYFPDYHPGDPRNQKAKGHGWSEWDLVRQARPRFPNHQQPKIPVWGYTDESDPKAMAQKIAAAADHGIDAFIFDWYYYNDGPYLQAALDNGFLKASNRAALKFALMWANHDWLDNFPGRKGIKNPLMYPGKVTPENFDKICDLVIRDYFKQSNYWLVDGKPYFSFYDLANLIAGFGGVDRTRQALDRFRSKAKAAGLNGVHLNLVSWEDAIDLPGEKGVLSQPEIVSRLGFDSVASYTWIHHAAMPQLQTPYQQVRDEYFKYWDRARKEFSVPYMGNVTMGWDPSPLTNQNDEYGDFGYPFTNTVSGNTPEQFKIALQQAKQKVLKEHGPHVIDLCCWNEWDEGSYLEPEKTYGMKYLEAIRDVLGK